MTEYDKYKESAFTHELMQPMVMETDMTDQFMEMLKERDEDGSCIVDGLNYAGEAYDRLEAQAAEIERLREALKRLAELDEFVCGKPQTINEVMNYTQFVARTALGEEK